MCVYFNPVPGGSEYEAWVKLVAKNNAKLNKEAVVQNKIMMQCATLGCPMQGELRTAQFGKPEGWYSVVVEGPTEKERVSVVLCPTCTEASLGSLVLKRPQAPTGQS